MQAVPPHRLHCTSSRNPVTPAASGMCAWIQGTNIIQQVMEPIRMLTETRIPTNMPAAMKMGSHCMVTVRPIQVGPSVFSLNQVVRLESWNRSQSRS